MGKHTPLTNLGAWFWESGYNSDMVKDIEQIRDLNLRAMYGAWDALKNVDGLYPYHRLNWVAFHRWHTRIPKAQRRRDLDWRRFQKEDPVRRWSLPPARGILTFMVRIPSFSNGHGGTGVSFPRQQISPEYRYEGPYWAPYRTLYSRNISNLLMAGRKR